MKRVIAGLTVVAILWGCQSFKEGYKTGFIKGWKESFIKSCVGSNDTERQREGCTCVAEKAVEQLTAKQLYDDSYTLNYIEDNILFLCGSQSFKEHYQERFVKNWKESFIQSCAGTSSYDMDRQREVCTCVAEKAAEELTAKQLYDASYTLNYIEDNILPVCH
jgi:hypothetical protein